MTVKNKILNILLVSSLILSVWVRNFAYMFPKHFYYISEAILLFVVCLYLYVKANNIFTFIVFFLSFSNLLDELFFDPKKLQLNEVAFAIVLILIALCRYDWRKSQFLGTSI